MPSATRPVVRRDLPVNPAPEGPTSPVSRYLPSAHAILCSARARLTDPARWLHGHEHEAVDVHGRRCLAWAPNAARWDLYGALQAAEGTVPATDEALRFLAHAAKLACVDLLAVAEWADEPERTHAEILAVLDAAINAAATGPLDAAIAAARRAL